MLKTIVEVLPEITSSGLGVFFFVWWVVKLEPQNRKELKNLADAIRASKELGIKELGYFAPVSIENTILRINRRIDLIVDRNSITDNIRQIEDDIIVLIDRETENGRAYLRQGFKEFILTKLFGSTDEMKQTAKDELTKHFKWASKKLFKVDEAKKDFRDSVRDCKEDLKDILDIYDNFELEKKKIYTILKREVWQVFETTIYNVQTQLNK